MKVKLFAVAVGLFAVVWLVVWSVSTRPAQAHCDTLDGPVVMIASTALEKGDVTPVLKWVRADHESEVREAFGQTLAVRKLGPEARELADRYFFETLVRLHRAGEGEPYTGLKPAGTDLSPSVIAADRALQTGSIEELSNLITGTAREGLQKRFAYALAAKQHADDSVEAGREYVEAYISFVHYGERLYADATSHEGHVAESPESHMH